MSRHADAWLVAGMLAGPILWLAALEADYALTAARCSVAAISSAHAITIGCALAAVIAAVVSYFAGATHAGDGASGRANGRMRWMALAALGLGGWFALATLAMELPISMLQRCAH